VALGYMLKLHLDMQPNDKYRDFDELRYIMFGAVFYSSLVVVLLPADVCAYPCSPSGGIPVLLVGQRSKD
jgi:hypothetical protein